MKYFLIVSLFTFVSCSSSKYLNRLYSGYSKVKIEQKEGKYERAMESYLVLETIRFNKEEYEVLIYVWDLYEILNEELRFSEYDEFVDFMVRKRKFKEPLVVNETLHRNLIDFLVVCKNDSGDSHLSGKELVKKYFDNEGYTHKDVKGDLACSFKRILSTEKVFISTGDEEKSTTLYYFKDLPKN